MLNGVVLQKEQCAIRRFSIDHLYFSRTIPVKVYSDIFVCINSIFSYIITVFKECIRLYGLCNMLNI